MDVSERQLVSTTGAMAGAAARPIVFGSRISLRIFAAEGLRERFQIFLVRIYPANKGHQRLKILLDVVLFIRYDTLPN